MKTPALLAALLLLPACATAASSDAEPGPKSGGPAAASAGPAAAAPGAEFAAPASLAEGDRWFVWVKGNHGPEPLALRSRRSKGAGFVRESMTWNRSFAAAAAAERGTEQVAALYLDAKGISVGLLDEGDKPVGEKRLEVAAPYRAGTEWSVDDGSGAWFHARIGAVEKVETPGGTVEALRVEVRSPHARAQVITQWYDRGLRPVRMEVRWLGATDVLEASAALASAAPTPEECRAAVEWAKKNLPPVAPR
jgi:hypothetical protein